jgi:hypothetical protein
VKSAKKTSDVIFLFLLFLMVAGIGITIALKPPKSFSERENRILQVFPKVSSESVLSGEFSRQLSSFYSDQLPLREELGYIYALSELSIGKRECNDVLVCDKSIFVQTPPKIESGQEILNNNLIFAKELQGRNNAVCFWAPRSSDVFYEQMPFSFRELSAEATRASNCQLTASMLDLISKSGAPSEYYYRTDHHWTTKGAYTAYKLLSSELDYKAYDESFFRKETAASDFFGTSFSRSAMPKAMTQPDSILLYRYDLDESVIVTDRESGMTKGLYDLSALDRYDKYRVFLGGNYAHLSVELPLQSEQKREKLLLVKDSFANSLIPFLALHFDIEVIDPRYATTAQIKKLCEEKEFDKVLVLCSLDTLSTERSVGRALDIID